MLRSGPASGANESGTPNQYEIACVWTRGAAWRSLRRNVNAVATVAALFRRDAYCQVSMQRIFAVAHAMRDETPIAKPSRLDKFAAMCPSYAVPLCLAALRLHRTTDLARPWGRTSFIGMPASGLSLSVSRTWHQERDGQRKARHASDPQDARIGTIHQTIHGVAPRWIACGLGATGGNRYLPKVDTKRISSIA